MKNDFIHLNEEQRRIEDIVNDALHGAIARHFIKPKKCNNCGEEYISEQDYTFKTARIGNAKDYKTVGSLFFHRNCKCGSTLGIGVRYNDLDSFQLYCILNHAHTLGEIAKKEAFKKLSKKESLKSSDFWKYMREFPHFKEEEDNENSISRVSEEEWQEIGLSILRDRYNMYVRGEKHRLHQQPSPMLQEIK